MRTIGLAVVLMILAMGSVWADDHVVYRQRVNLVKIESIPSKEMVDLAPNHPYSPLTAEQMKGMLLALRISKKHIIKKDIDQQEIFTEDEAERFAPYLVEALQQVNPDEWVVLSVVQKRPFFIIRNDRLTLANLWVEGDQVHIRFKKIYAKLSGDYEATGQQERLLKSAKGVTLSLEAGPGQLLSDRSTQEILLDTHFDYAGWWASVPRTDSGEPVAIDKREVVQSQAPAAAKPAKSVKERLEELDQLKKDGLITKDEYDTIRKSILSEI